MMEYPVFCVGLILSVISSLLLYGFIQKVIINI